MHLSVSYGKSGGIFTENTKTNWKQPRPSMCMPSKARLCSPVNRANIIGVNVSKHESDVSGKLLIVSFSDFAASSTRWLSMLTKRKFANLILTALYLPGIALYLSSSLNFKSSRSLQCTSQQSLRHGRYAPSSIKCFFFCHAHHQLQLQQRVLQVLISIIGPSIK